MWFFPSIHGTNHQVSRADPVLACNEATIVRSFRHLSSLAEQKRWRCGDDEWQAKISQLTVPVRGVFPLCRGHEDIMGDLLIQVPRHGRPPFRRVQLVRLSERDVGKDEGKRDRKDKRGDKDKDKDKHGYKYENEHEREKRLMDEHEHDKDKDNDDNNNGALVMPLPRSRQPGRYRTKPVHSDIGSEGVVGCLDLDWQSIDVYNRLFVEPSPRREDHKDDTVIWRLPLPFVHSANLHPLPLVGLSFTRLALQFDLVVDKDGDCDGDKSKDGKSPPIFTPKIFAEVCHSMGSIAV